MASYESIRAAAEDGLLLETPKTNSLKGLVAGAAIFSFVLGMVAATAVTQHAMATQTNLNAVGSVVNAANSPSIVGEESCGGQWGFALAFGSKDAKNQCPPGSQCDKTSNTCMPNSYFETLDDPQSGVVGIIANHVSARVTRRVQALEERRR